MRLFHGTTLSGAHGFLAGLELDASAASRNKIDGEPGFFLATVESDAEFFAARRGRGAIIVVDVEEVAVETLVAARAQMRPIPVTIRSPLFRGTEMWIPPDVFHQFNQLRLSGSISVHA